MNDIFTTNEYKVLKTMYENTLTVANIEYCPLGQAEIADELGLSRANVNKIFKQLKDARYIIMLTRGKWQLSESATNMIKITQEL